MNRRTIALLVLALCVLSCRQHVYGYALKSTKVPRFDTAVQKAVSFLQAQEKISEKEIALTSYALLKAGLTPADPAVARGIARAAERANLNRYDHYHGTYTASVDAMLLADVDEVQYGQHLQNIADHLMRLQQPNGCWSADRNATGDVSLTQYCVLGLWAAQRAQCHVEPRAFDMACKYLVSNANPDGGWRYRPGTNTGPEQGASSHNMTLAAVGTLGIAELMLFAPPAKKEEQPKKFGILEKVEPEAVGGGLFPDYRPTTSKASIDAAIKRGMSWHQVRASPIAKGEFPLYFYYTFERAASVMELDTDWFTYYGDGLLSLQEKDGHFKSHSAAVAPPAATSFAILYYMRSTKQIIDKQYGSGQMSGGRNPEDLFGKTQKKKELSSLDVLLAKMDEVDLSELDGLDTNDIVESVQFGSKEELIGQVDRLKLLIESNNAENRKAAYFALGRTGDFSLVPLMIQGLRDPNLDVNVTAVLALRYIARKPNGFGIPLKPLAGAETANEETRLKTANEWRTKAWKTWMNWYREVRPFEETGGLDELEVASPRR